MRSLLHNSFFLSPRIPVLDLWTRTRRIQGYMLLYMALQDPLSITQFSKRPPSVLLLR